MVGERWRNSDRKQLAQAPGDRLGRLAAAIEALAAKDEATIRFADDMAKLRRRAAVALYTVCAEFTAAINQRITRATLLLDPPAFAPEAFDENGPNLFQINVRGRLLQIEFEATPELVSTEDFRIPYTLLGTVRSFNQERLERTSIEEQLLFFCLEGDQHYWRFFDARSYRSGRFDQDYLISLIEQIV